eukprot:3849320-Pyramimonas_sp.AAC.1
MADVPLEDALMADVLRPDARGGNQRGRVHLESRGLCRARERWLLHRGRLHRGRACWRYWYHASRPCR